MVLSYLAHGGVGADSSPDDCDGSGDCRILLHEDFEGYDLYKPPPNWTIEIPGYGKGGIYVEESFQKDNRRLHMMSSANIRARISHNITPTSPHLEVALKVNIVEEETFPQIMEPLAFSFGLKTNSTGRINLLELGRSDNQTILPYNQSYDQGTWISFRAVVDLDSSLVHVYKWDDYIGNTSIPAFAPADIMSVYLLLGEGAWYKGRFDEIQVREYVVTEAAIPGVLAILLLVGWRYGFPHL